MTGRWFSPVSPTHKTDRHDITEIFLKVALSALNHKPVFEYKLFAVASFYVVNFGNFYCNFGTSFSSTGRELLPLL